MSEKRIFIVATANHDVYREFEFMLHHPVDGNIDNVWLVATEQTKEQLKKTLESRTAGAIFSIFEFSGFAYGGDNSDVKWFINEHKPKKEDKVPPPRKTTAPTKRDPFATRQMKPIKE